MAVISFGQSEEQVWLVARWAHSRFLHDVMTSCQGDDACEFEIKQAIALDGLHFDLVCEKDEKLADRIKNVMKEVASATVDGKDNLALKWKEGLSEDAQRMYLDGVQALLHIMRG